MMNPFNNSDKNNRLISIYELLVWLIYVCLFKYSIYAGSPDLPHMRTNFPFPQLILFSICMTCYMIPFYRLIGPYFLKKKRYVLLFFITLVYFAFFSKWCNWLVTFAFYKGSTDPVLTVFYKNQFTYYNSGFFPRTVNISILLTDWLAFFSVMFIRYAFDIESKKHALEKDNLVLQLETLKAQLHPHFLFNTLNSIYGMSLAGAKETPAFILRLSDMMRYMLYDCQQHLVPVEKDIEFLDNYLEMEKKRYPYADISFTIKQHADNKTIAPLLLIPFVENSFKHGAHRVMDSGSINGSLQVLDTHLLFTISNNVLAAAVTPENTYGGVGIANVQKRLALYYPAKHELHITNDGSTFTVNLKIEL